ncbi:PAS domain-containing protein, partial [Flavonifractor plautii]
MPEASTLQFLFQLAKWIASQLGPNCEVVVH